MPQLLPVHQMTVGTAVYFFRANMKTYDGIGADTGVEQPPTTDLGKWEGKKILPVGELTKDNDVQRVTLYFKVGAKPRSARVLVAKEKLQALLDKDGTLSYKQDPKTRVRQPRRDRFS